MGDEIDINGKAYDRNDVDLNVMGFRFAGARSFDFSYTMAKGRGLGRGSRPRGITRGAKTGTFRLALAEESFNEWEVALRAAGLDLTDLAPFPIICSIRKKVKEVVSGMATIAYETDLSHVRIFDGCDIDNVDSTPMPEGEEEIFATISGTYLP